MVRTQVYLTDRERDELAVLARSTGRKQSELIREAVDRLIEQSATKRRHAVLAKAAGMWSDRDDLPDFKKLRRMGSELVPVDKGVIVDTDVMVDYLRGNPAAVKLHRQACRPVGVVGDCCRRACTLA